jgi:hypothetical protein
MLGFLTGAVIFGAAYPVIFPPINAIINLGSTILPTALNVDLWLSILLFVLMALTMFYFLEKFGPLRKDKVNS